MNLLEQLTALIASFKDSPGESRLFRDAFCENCPNGHEIIDGTAQDLAQKILDLGWGLDPLRDDYLNCPECLNLEAPPDPIGEREDCAYAQYELVQGH